LDIPGKSSVQGRPIDNMEDEARIRDQSTVVYPPGVEEIKNLVTEIDFSLDPFPCSSFASGGKNARLKKSPRLRAFFIFRNGLFENKGSIFGVQIEPGSGDLLEIGRQIEIAFRSVEIGADVEASVRGILVGILK